MVQFSDHIRNPDNSLSLDHTKTGHILPGFRIPTKSKLGILLASFSKFASKTT